jgi:ZIP family zinc transporter
MHIILTILIISAIGPVAGSLIGVMKRPSRRFMYHMLSFAAGVMIAISFLELIPESINLSSVIVSSIGITAGALIMFLLDRVLPHIHPEFGVESNKCPVDLQRTAIYLIIGIFLHNFPEGIAIALGSVSGIKMSIIIALAITVHDVPEGIITSAPYYYCSKKRLKSFLISASTAIPTFFGFLLAYYIFQNISIQIVGFLVAATAGLMIYISGHELIPASCQKLTSHKTTLSFIAGVIFVALLGLL